jgi:hypothetical protein
MIMKHTSSCSLLRNQNFKGVRYGKSEVGKLMIFYHISVEGFIYIASGKC